MGSTGAGLEFGAHESARVASGAGNASHARGDPVCGQDGLPVATITKGIWAMDDSVLALSTHETASKLGSGANGIACANKREWPWGIRLSQA